MYGLFTSTSNKIFKDNFICYRSWTIYSIVSQIFSCLEKGYIRVSGNFSPKRVIGQSKIVIKFCFFEVYLKASCALKCSLASNDENFFTQKWLFCLDQSKILSLIENMLKRNSHTILLYLHLICLQLSNK